MKVPMSKKLKPTKSTKNILQMGKHSTYYYCNKDIKKKILKKRNSISFVNSLQYIYFSIINPDVNATFNTSKLSID